MKRSGLTLILTGMLLLSATACNAEETKTVDWYSAPENKVALDAEIAECKNNPGELWETPNCKNARAAMERKVTSGTFQKVEEPAVPRFSSPPSQ